jgi:hypothetical protein
MRHLRLAGAVLALTVIAASYADAQRTTRSAGAPRSTQAASRTSEGSWEFGADASLSIGLDEPSVTIFRLIGGTPAGVSSVRAGYFISDVISVEPMFGMDYLKVEDIDAITTYTIGVGGLYHFSTDPTRSRMYVRPFLSLLGVSAGGDGDSELGVGVGFGMKWPKLGGRIAIRGEANVFAINDNSSINLMVGLSAFTR